MRILILNWLDRENPQGGGAETHLHETFGRLASWGHSVTLLCSGWPGAPARLELDGIQIHRVAGRYSFALQAHGYYRRHLAEQAFDVVIEDLNKIPLFTPLWVGRPVALLVHHLFGATAFTEAALPVATMTWLLERPIPRVYRNIPTVAVSESTAQDLASRGMDRECIKVIPNGIDLASYAPGQDEDRAPEPTVLYLGRLKRYKRVDLLIRALALLHDRNISCRLLVAGKGDREASLRTLAQKLGVADQVDFLGFVDEEEKRRLFRTAWIHALTSSKEGWGITNLEAAACETPTVASDAPGLRDSVLHGETGLLVPHGDPTVLATALGDLLGDHDRRKAMGSAARIFAQQFTWDSSARKMERFLNSRVV